MPKLKPEVARKYEFGTHHTKVDWRGRLINLCELTLSEANALVASGNFPYLLPKRRKK
ncbi:hypothetical protein [Pontibacter sp. SGAir0037]|uniref:hypothetical protein n=1 Tax=Pontibacter sp. SGAir0037 TaxID=2571030 RepID=UPI00143D719A|nr:hypothetical protein [Pontibacter sp. SGAir0037]